MKWDESRANFKRNLAVIIGIDHYDHPSIHDLSSAVNDANRFADLLRQEYNYQEEHIIRLFSPRPDAAIDHLSQPYRPGTLDELNILLDDTLPNKLKPTDADRLLLYFAGHGIAENGDQGPAGYLIPQTAELGNPKTYLPMQRLSAALNQLECHHLLVVLDCCFGGAFRWASTRKLIADLEVIHKENYDRFIRFPAWQVITSAAHDQEALDLSVDRRVIGKAEEAREASVHSPFAQALFEGLQENKADLIADGIITAHELYCYLDNRVSMLSNNQQTPGIYPIRRDYDKGEYIFTQPGFSPDHLKAAPPLNRDNNPYRGLKPFEEKHARLFFGRKALRKELVDRLNQPTDIQVERLKSNLGKIAPPLTVVLGGSGSGKSSLVQAGLLPDLRKQSDRWYILDPFRPGETPFKALARAILPIVRPELLQQLEQADFVDAKLRSLLAADAPTPEPDPQAQIKKLARSWINVTPEARLLILEDYFTQSSASYSAQLQGLFSKEQVQQFENFNRIIQAALRKIATDLEQPQYLAQSITDWSQQPGQGDRKLLMVIDQFEELVTMTPSSNKLKSGEQAAAPQGYIAFLECVRLALITHPQRLRVLLTLRSDFEPRFLTSPLQDWWQYARFPVRPMNSQELREAIEGPAEIQALYFEPSDLVGILTDEVGQMPGALPLLSFTLSELYNELAKKWQRGEASDRALRLEDYNKLGGVAGSLSKRATEEYENLVSEAPEGFGSVVGKMYQATMQRVMLRMVTIEGSSVARRKVLEAELEYPTAAESKRVAKVVERLVTARLLVRGQETGIAYVEPAHDSLVRGWDKLQKWLKEEQETLALQQRLISAATDWNTRKQVEVPIRWRDKVSNVGDRSVFCIVEFFQSKRRKALQKRRFKAAQKIREDAIGYLWDEDPRLGQLNRLVGSPDSWFNRTEDLFVRQSVVEKEKNWIGKVLLAVGIILLTGALLRWVLLSQKDRLLEQVRASRESAEANLQSDRQLEALIDTLQAGKALNDPLNWLNPYLWTAPAEVEAQVKETLFKMLSSVRERNRLQLNRAAIYNVAVSPQGDELATTEDDDTVRLWNRFGRQLDQFPTGQDGVKSAAFSADGKQLATGGDNGTVLLWTIKDRKVDLTQPPVEIFKAYTGALPKGAIISLAFSQNPANKTPQLAIVDSNFKLWLWSLPKQRMSAANAQLRASSADTNIYSVAFNPERDQFATVSDDDIVELWDGVTGKRLDRFSTGQKIVYSVAFRDRYHLATGGAGKHIKLWRIGDDRKIDPSVKPDNISTEQSSTYSLSFSRTGLLATVGNDEAVTIHTGVSKLIGDPKIQPARGNRQDVKVQGLAFSPNGKLIATVSADNQLRLWDLAGRQVARFQVSGEDVNGVAFSPNGELIATSAADGTIDLRDTRGNSLDQISLPFRQSRLVSIVFEPKGQRLAAIAQNGVVEWLTLEDQAFKRTGETPVIESFQVPVEDIQRLAFAPNLRQVAVLKTDGTVGIWDYPTRQLLFPLPDIGKKVSGITFSPNGQSFATAHPDGAVTLWQVERDAKDTLTGMRFSNLEFQTQQGEIKNIAFSRVNSNLLVTGGQDGTARLWDISTGQPPQVFLPAVGKTATSKAIVTQAAFSPDAQRLATLRADRKLQVWQVNPQNTIQSLQEPPPHPGGHPLAPVKSLVFSSDNTLLAVIGKDETIQLWDTALEEWLTPISAPAGHQITRLIFSPDRQQFAVLEQDQDHQGRLRLYRRSQSTAKAFDLQEISNDGLKQMDLTSVAFSPTGNQIATARLSENGSGGIVTVWNQAIDTKIGEFKTQYPIEELLFNQDEQLATFDIDRTVTLWDLDDGKQEIGEFQTSEPPDLLDFNPAPSISDLLPLTPPNAETPQSLHLPTQRIFSPDGRLVAIAHQGKLSLWNALGNRLNLFPSAQQTDSTLSAAFDADGKRLIAIGPDGKLSFWQVGSIPDLMVASCDLLQNYLKNNPTIDPGDRDLCSDILTPTDSENTSIGEKLLIAKITNSEKQAGVEAAAAGDFTAASQHFYKALDANRNDPETRIYWNNAQIRNQPAYTIAVAVPISSDVEGSQEILRGVAQAQYEINQSGGIQGNPLRILIADDQGTDEMARQTAQNLVANPDVLGVVGHFSSNATLAAGEIYNQNHLVAISPVSTSVALSNLGDYIFRTVPNDQQAAQKLADYMLKQNLHKAAIFYNSQSKYSASLRSEFQSALKSGGQITGEFDVSNPYFDAQTLVDKALDEGAEVLVLLTDNAQLDNALGVVNANQQRLPLLAGDDVYTLRTLQEQDNAIDLVISVPWSVNSAPPEFITTSNRLWSAAVNWRTALSYDATKALIAAMQRSGDNPTREQIAAMLHSDNFAIEGASGKVAFQSSGDRAPDNKLDHSLVRVVKKSDRSRSGTGYDFEAIDLSGDR